MNHLLRVISSMVFFLVFCEADSLPDAPRKSEKWGIPISTRGASLPKDPNEYAAWEARSMAAIEELKSEPPEVAIPKLGLKLRQLDRGAMEPGDRPVFRAAQATLLSIPGHAEYYRNRINEMYEEAKAEAERYDLIYFNSPLEWGSSLTTLSYLPSVETVRVLGKMLDDMRSLDRSNSAPKDWTDSSPLAPPAYSAARKLTQLELGGAPMKRFVQVSREEMARMSAEEYYNMNIEPWRLWYAQVKSGKRTFRFKGSEVEYNLDGPVRIAAVAPSLRQGAAAEAAGPEEASRTSPWPLIGALLVLAAAGGWYFVRRKHPA